MYSDSNACIYKIGLFTERLVQEILAFEGIVEPEKDNTHANRIRLLKRAGLLPREIDNTLYFLRRTRNSAVHAGADSVDEAKVLISMTFNLATWFMKTYGDWAYARGDFSEESDIDIKPIAKNLSHYQKWLGAYPFYSNIHREGVKLFEAA